jgi:PAS domain S-box-containing protein
MPMDEKLYQRILAKDETLIEVNVSDQDLSEEDITNLLRALIKNEKVKTLNISGNNITSRNLRLLFSPSLHITHVIARYCDIEDIPSFSDTSGKDDHATPIIYLDLTGNLISTTGIIELSKSGLEFLSLSDTGLTDAEALPLADMRCIKTLILSHNAIRRKTTSRLAINSSLKELYLHNNNMSGTDIMPILASQSITTLGMGGNILDKAVAQGIAINTILETLNINNCKVTDELAIELLKNKSLKYLSIAFNYLTEISTSAFLAVNLIRLNISYNKLKDKGAIIIAEHLTITELIIRSNKIALEGARALSKNKILKTLDLSCNSANNAVTMLAANNTLTSLSLFDNKIDDTAVFAFVYNTTLLKLDLDYHQISDKAKEVFLEEYKGKMRVNFSIRQLYDRVAWENLFDSESPAIICDPNTKIIQAVNPAFLANLGYMANQVIGKSIYDFLYLKDRTSEQAAAQNALEKEDKKEQLTLDELYKRTSFNYEYETRIRCKDGSYRYINWRAWFRNGAQCSVGHDITVQKRADKTSSRIERDTYFRQSMAHQFHEIRNLIIAASGISEQVTLVVEKLKTLLNELESSIQEIETPNAIQSQLAVMHNLVDEISEWMTNNTTVINDERQILDDSLDFSKLEANKVVFKEEPLNLKTLIKLVISRNKFEGDKKRLQFEFKADETWVLGDEKYLGQIITNLVGNAVKFSPLNGIIIIDMIIQTIDAIYSAIAINVADQGPGIKKEDITQLFQPYHQTALGKSKEHSTGLGLNIANKLAKQMINGGITVKSEEGKGATFTLSCNLARSEPVISLAKVKRVQQVSHFFRGITPAAIGGKYILIAEDHLVAQKLLRRQFAGYRVKIVSTGTEALQFYKDNKNDIFFILMDVNMPGFNGFQVAKQIREVNKDLLEQKMHELRSLQTDVPIVLMSATVTPEYRKLALLYGINAILAKPVTNQALEEVVNSLPSSLKEAPSHERTTSAPSLTRRNTIGG